MILEIGKNLSDALQGITMGISTVIIIYIVFKRNKL